MAIYPILPFALTNEDLVDMYNQVRTWGDVLIQELDARDLDIDNAAASTVFTVTTVIQIGRPQKGDIAYSVSSGKFKGYVSLGAETSWQDLN
mgnify:FL=1